MRTNEENLDLFADLLEPAGEIIGDKRIAEAVQKGEKPIVAVKIAIKEHHAAVIEILARLEDKEPSEYVVGSPFILAGKLLKLFNSPEVQELFIGQGQTKDAASSGSAMENIKGEA